MSSQPQGMRPAGISGGLASLVPILGWLPPAELVALLRRALAEDRSPRDPVLSGVSELPNGCRVSARMLGRPGSGVERAKRVAWNAARLALIGAPAPDLRKA